MFGLSPSIYYLSQQLKTIVDNEISNIKIPRYKRNKTKSFKITYLFSECQRKVVKKKSIQYTFDSGTIIDLPTEFKNLCQLTLSYSSKLEKGLCGQMSHWKTVGNNESFCELFLTHVKLDNIVHEFTHLIHFINATNFYNSYSNYGNLEAFDSNKVINKHYVNLARLLYLTSYEEINCVQAQSATQLIEMKKSGETIDIEKTYYTERKKESYEIYTTVFNSISKLTNKRKIDFMSKFCYLRQLHKSAHSIPNAFFRKNLGFYQNCYYDLRYSFSKKPNERNEYRTLSLKESESLLSSMSQYVITQLEKSHLKARKLNLIEEPIFY